jgi:UDP-glucose 4-epimerase
MNILVTGGAGFIGSHTVVALYEAGYTPIIIDDFSNSEERVLHGLEEIIGQPVICYRHDCNDAAFLDKLFQKHQFAGVIHFAAHKAVGESMEQPLKYYRNNLLSLVTLLETMLRHNVQRIIFSSSCTVYGNPEKLPVTEATPVQPAQSVYGNTKAIGEEIIRDTVSAGTGLKAISLRYFNPIGAHPTAKIGELPLGIPNNLVPFVTQTAAGIRKELTVFGNDYPTPDGSCIRDYIHVMDLAEAHVAALQHLQKIEMPMHYDTYNVGTGQGNSVLEIIKAFEEVSGQSLPHSIGKRRMGDIPAIYGDVTKAADRLGWKTKRTLRDGLADAWRWQQQLKTN